MTSRPPSGILSNVKAGGAWVATPWGGVIMGQESSRSVTNSFGQTHDIPNLFIAGSSLFPTGGAVNPTLTIYALTQRTATYMLDNWARLG